MARITSCGWEMNTALPIYDTPYFRNLSGGATMTTSSTVKNTINGVGGKYALQMTNAGANGQASYDLIWRSTVESNDNGPFWFRFYLRVDAAPSADSQIVLWYGVGGGSTNRGQVKLNTAGALELWSSVDSSPAQIGSDSASILADGLFHRVEGKFQNNGANMTLELLLDGETVATGTATVSVGGAGRIFFGMQDSTTGYNVYMDDFALNDSSGARQNAYPGAGVEIILRPNAAGDTNNLSGGTGTTFAEFDEVTPDDATSYSTLPTNNNLVDFKIDDPANQGMGANDAVNVVQVGTYMRGASAGTNQANARIKSQPSGTVYSGSATTAATTTWLPNYGTPPAGQGDRYNLSSHTDPQAGGVWTRALLQTAQIGVIATDADPDIWVSSLWALVDFVPSTITQGTIDTIDPANGTTTVTIPAGLPTSVDTYGVNSRTCTTSPLTTGSNGVTTTTLTGQTGSVSVNTPTVPGCTTSVVTWYTQGSTTVYGTTSTSSSTTPAAASDTRGCALLGGII